MPPRKPKVEDPSVLTVSSDKIFVYYEKSLTKNMGNYESAKVTVGVTLPINPTEEEKSHIKRTIEIADEIVTDELTIQLDDLLGDK